MSKAAKISAPVKGKIKPEDVSKKKKQAISD